MHFIRKSVFLCLALVTLTLAGIATLPKSAEAWAICHEGSTRWTDLHCTLGSPGDCSECWVTP